MTKAILKGVPTLVITDKQGNKYFRHVEDYVIQNDIYQPPLLDNLPALIVGRKWKFRLPMSFLEELLKSRPLQYVMSNTLMLDPTLRQAAWYRARKRFPTPLRP